MPNDSSTGGFVTPSTTMGDLEDQALNRFLHDLIAGITGIPVPLVRPRWQQNPPNLPPFGTDWVAFGEVSRKTDRFAFVTHQDSSSGGNDAVYRNQILEILCTFYGPNSKANSELLSLGFQIAQNREALTLAGYGLVEVGDPVTTSELIQEQWVSREDVSLRLRRAQEYKYPILNLLGAQGTVVTDSQAGLAFQQQKPLAALPMFAWGLSDSVTFAGWGQGNWK